MLFSFLNCCWTWQLRTAIGFCSWKQNPHRILVVFTQWGPHLSSHSGEVPEVALFLPTFDFHVVLPRPHPSVQGSFFSWTQSPKEITKGQPWPYHSSWLFKQLPWQAFTVRKGKSHLMSTVFGSYHPGRQPPRVKWPLDMEIAKISQSPWVIGCWGRWPIFRWQNMEKV